MAPDAARSFLARLANDILSPEQAGAEYDSRTALQEQLRALAGQTVVVGKQVATVEYKSGELLIHFIRPGQGPSVLAAGARSVAIQGSVINSAIMTGDILLQRPGPPPAVTPDLLRQARRQLAAMAGAPWSSAGRSLPPRSRMPLPPSPLFVGRHKELTILTKAIQATQPVIICPEETTKTSNGAGDGGIGKSSLAAAFVHTWGHYFAGGVFWLSFADPSAVDREIAACGRLGALHIHPSFALWPRTKQVNAVRALWEQEIPRLLIFDHCEDDQLLHHWLPRSGGCRVLVTSRRLEWSPRHPIQQIPLGPLSQADSVHLLCQFRPDLPPDDDDLNTLAAHLAGHPQRLRLAGHDLWQYRHDLSPAAYLRALQEKTDRIPL